MVSLVLQDRRPPSSFFQRTPKIFKGCIVIAVSLMATSGWNWRLLEQGEATEGKDAMETQMILNHKAAIEFWVEQADEADLNRYTILNLHALLSDNLLADPQACGRLQYRARIKEIVAEVVRDCLNKRAAALANFFQLFPCPCL
jgi:hypothetical protein